jgi:hypothetical protein
VGDSRDSELKVSIHGKEMLLVSEDEHWVIIPCAWGVDPAFAFLQPIPRWREINPARSQLGVKYMGMHDGSHVY